MVQLATPIKNGIMKHANVSVKFVVRGKNIILGILAHVFVKIISILKSLLIIQTLCVMKL